MPITREQLQRVATFAVIPLGLVLIFSLGYVKGRSGGGSVVASSNLALTYFHAGASVGAYVERVRPGLPPQQLLQLARNHYASLGPDPYLSPQTSQASVNTSKAMQALSTTQAQKARPPLPAGSTNAPATNSPVLPATNSSPATP